MIVFLKFNYAHLLNPNGKVDNWRSISQWLEDAGYKTESSTEEQLGDCLLLKFLIKKANIVLDKKQVIVDINLRIIASSPVEIEKKKWNIEIPSKEKRITC